MYCHKSPRAPHFIHFNPEEGRHKAETLVAEIIKIYLFGARSLFSLSKMQTRNRSKEVVSYLNPLGVEPPVPKTKRIALPLPTAPTPAPTLAHTEVGSQIARSAPEQDTAIVLDTEMTEEEEDNILGITNQATERKTLLSLRQQFKKTCTNMARVKSHLNFLAQCRNEEKIPRGLTVNVQCNC